jgi:uncharacterized membrane protein (DUF485 family)
MNTDLVSRVRRNPKFAELERKRSLFSRQLAFLMLVIYGTFIYAVAFAKPFLATKVGAVATLAFPIGIGVILSAILITAWYVNRANGEYEQLTREIVEDAR